MTECNVCGKRFTASSNLYYHRMTHIKVSIKYLNYFLLITLELKKSSFRIKIFFLKFYNLTSVDNGLCLFRDEKNRILIYEYSNVIYHLETRASGGFQSFIYFFKIRGSEEIFNSLIKINL